MANIITTIFHDIENIFKKLFAAEPKLAQTVTATIAVVAPLVETILVVTGDEAAAVEIEQVVEQVEADLAAITGLVKTSGATPTLQSVLAAVETDLKSLLTAGDIKDSGTITKVTDIVDTIVAELQAIVGAVNAQIQAEVKTGP